MGCNNKNPPKAAFSDKLDIKQNRLSGVLDQSEDSDISQNEAKKHAWLFK